MAGSSSYLKNCLLGLLSAILPTSEETELLRACLWPGEAGAEAWRKWSREIADPAAFLRQEKEGIKGLLPLLFDTLQTNGVVVEGEFRTYLRTAYLRDQLRSRTYSQICRDVISTFAGAGIPAVLLKGAVFAESCYKSPELQHAHYLEILIRDEDLNRAVATLRPHAFTCASTAGWEEDGVELVHESGLPLVLHRRLFRLPFYSINMEEIWTRSGIEVIYDTPTRVLCSTDNLFHVCGSVFDLEPYHSLRWVCDAWFIIQRSPNLDWKLLTEFAHESRMVLPLMIATHYLSESLNAPIPASFIAGLQAAALETRPIEGEAALFTVQTSARGGLKKIILSCDDWPTRKFVLKWALLPSLEYMRCVYRVPTTLLLPFSYLDRPLRYLLRSMWFFGRRMARRLREKFEPLLGTVKVVSS
jgi:putative nucleotidyltransferase-like protein